MQWMLFLVFGAPVGGVLLAVVWWLIRRRGVRSLAGTVAVFTVLAGVLAVAAEWLIRLASSSSLLVPIHPSAPFVIWYFDNRYVLPLAVGVVALALLAFPIRARRGVGVGDLAPRGVLRFTHPRWLIAPAVVFGVILLITLVAGAASRPDPTTGRYDMYVVEIDGETTMATALYGWFYSVPALIVTALLAATATGVLLLIARPPLTPDSDADARIRSIRSGNVILVVTGALLLHLGLISQSLAATASLAAEMPSELGRITLWTPVAAMVPLFIGASYAATVFGVALWATVALTGLGVRRHAPVLARS